jgi:triosephosphate isomerase
MRKKIIAANWKMNMTVSESEAFLATFLQELGSESSVEVVIIPPFTALAKVSEILGRGQQAKLGAQNMSAEKSGAFTGEISAQMLRELYVRYVVIGHSERRTLFGETDETVNRKVRAAIDAALKPIVCIGETLEQRDADQVEAVLHRQIETGLHGLSTRELGDTVIAYEPVWAIGTGRTATPEQAQSAHAFIRKTLSELWDAATAEKVRIQYGGSVKPQNAGELLHSHDIDGALVGGASLEPRGFADIVKAARAE